MKKLLIFILCTFLTFAIVQQVYAYSLLGGKHQTNNITYVIRDFNGTYDKVGKHLNTAISEWNATSTKISFSALSGTGRPQIVIKSDDYGNTGWSGRATNYREWVTFGDYVDSVVQGNLYYLNQTGYDSNDVKGVWSHELGHALGLGHVSGSNKLMYDNDGRTVYKPTQDEIDGVNSLYK